MQQILIDYLTMGRTESEVLLTTMFFIALAMVVILIVFVVSCGKDANDANSNFAIFTTIMLSIFFCCIGCKDTIISKQIYPELADSIQNCSSSILTYSGKFNLTYNHNTYKDDRYASRFNYILPGTITYAYEKEDGENFFILLPTAYKDDFKYWETSSKETTIKVCKVIVNEDVLSSVCQDETKRQRISDIFNNLYFLLGFGETEVLSSYYGEDKSALFHSIYESAKNNKFYANLSVTPETALTTITENTNLEQVKPVPVEQTPVEPERTIIPLRTKLTDKEVLAHLNEEMCVIKQDGKVQRFVPTDNVTFTTTETEAQLIYEGETLVEIVVFESPTDVTDINVNVATTVEIQNQNN